ncbi:S8 family serine peptidase [Streptosporangium sp. 'caverna']|uniref:S8 family peptidase n=1 Tax=Streptosporangium sp. 'caverna' TaxID=2202249 RepID=UPI001EF85859|nr:S8 family serine peptidase [Streptosporangium sp. 'caverna']
MLRRRRVWAAGALIAVSLTVPTTLAAPVAAADVREDQRWVLEKMNVEQAWRVTKGAGVTVALVDSGVDDEVAELRGRVISGPNMGSVEYDRKDPGAGLHGTAMASLIAGAGNGEGGLLGIAPEARILSLPMIIEQDATDGSAIPEENLRSQRDSPLARAIRYAANNGAEVVSMSLGAYGAQKSEREAISYALSRGVVLIAAVGNEGESEYAMQNGTSFWNFPAGYSGVVGVAAVDEQGKPALFSSDNLSVLVSAPGVDVPVVMPGGDYGVSEGTSSATALVSGVAALIKAKYPDISPQMVSQALTSTATSAPAAGYDDHVGFGVVDAGAALTKAGELVAGAAEVPAVEDQHFGKGPLVQEPPRPGPAPLRLWLYGGGLLGGLLAFAGAVIMLVRRPEPAVPMSGAPPANRRGSGRARP